ncbi:hypothetical protein [uncultured Oscillibacter sp.]|jgi:hypothetical protein|uniref:hypothetical protein n=1 Tax=uncultured Oscillibacter sp. TaxID=876091 RepID=UPI00266EF321|nr:hypothetical protein [uncultured Oscillibacter sp.]
MAIFFSTVLFFGVIVAAAAGIILAVRKVRHRETKAGRVCIAAAVVTVVCFVGFGLTYEPSEKPEDPPPTASSTEPEGPGQAQGDAQEPTEPPPATTPPVTTTEPEDPPQGTTEPPAASTPETTEPPAAPDQSAGQTEPPAETGTPEGTEPPEEVDPIEQAQQDIEEATRALFAEWYKNTTVDSVTVNEHLGTEKEGDFVLLVYATWDVKNSVKMTNKMLATYSEDFAARVGQELENVQDLSVFWTVPYYSETDISVKYSYERAGAGMYETGHMILVE